MRTGGLPRAQKPRHRPRDPGGPQVNSSCPFPIRRAARVLASAVALAGLLAAPAMADTRTFTPVADAYVSSGARGTNYGSTGQLKVDASPTIRSYLRFDVQLPDGATITGASLRMNTSTSSTGPGYQVYAVASTSWG